MLAVAMKIFRDRASYQMNQSSPTQPSNFRKHGLQFGWLKLCRQLRGAYGDQLRPPLTALGEVEGSMGRERGICESAR